MRFVLRGNVVLFCIVVTSISIADHPTVLFGSDKTGPITTIAADTLPKGAWVFGVQTEVVNFNAFSDSQLKNFAAQGQVGVHSLKRLINTSLYLGYGLNDQLTLSIRQPYIQRSNIREGHLELGVPEVHAHGDATGIGNVSVLMQYRFLRSNDTSVAALFGVTLPTGQNKRSDISGTRFETEFQPNPGATDYHLGLAYSTKLQSLSLHANLLYSINGDADENTRFGNALFYNLAVSYPLKNHDHGHAKAGPSDHQHLHWSIVLELNGENRRRNEIAGVSEIHSGGDLIYLAPGVRISAGSHWSGFLSFAVPVLQNLNGVQAEVNYRIMAGLSYAF